MQQIICDDATCQPRNGSDIYLIRQQVYLVKLYCSNLHINVLKRTVMTLEKYTLQSTFQHTLYYWPIIMNTAKPSEASF